MLEFLIAAVFCAGVECEPVTFVVIPRSYEKTDDWCERYAQSKAYDMSRHFIPRTELTVQEDSVVCQQLEG